MGIWNKSQKGGFIFLRVTVYTQFYVNERVNPPYFLHYCSANKWITGHTQILSTSFHIQNGLLQNLMENNLLFRFRITVSDRPLRYIAIFNQIPTFEWLGKKPTVRNLKKLAEVLLKLQAFYWNFCNVGGFDLLQLFSWIW